MQRDTLSRGRGGPSKAKKGKTPYTHKSHGCGLGGWFSLIKRKGTERQSWRRAAHTGNGIQHVETKGGIIQGADFPNLSYVRVFFFSSYTL